MQMWFPSRTNYYCSVVLEICEVLFRHGDLACWPGTFWFNNGKPSKGEPQRYRHVEVGEVAAANKRAWSVLHGDLAKQSKRLLFSPHWRSASLSRWVNVWQPVIGSMNAPRESNGSCRKPTGCTARRAQPITVRCRRHDDVGRFQ